MLAARLNLAGTAKLRAALERLRANSVATRPVMQAFGLHMKTIVGRSIQRQADPTTGKPWAALAPMTVGARPGKGGGAKALYSTSPGGLASSFKNSLAVTDTTATIKSDLKYAAIQQHGGTVKPKDAEKLAAPLVREAARAGSARRWIQQQRAAGKHVVFTDKAICLAVGKGKRRHLKAYWARFASVTIPKRPYLGFAPEDKTKLQDMLRAHLARGAKL